MRVSSGLRLIVTAFVSAAAMLVAAVHGGVGAETAPPLPERAGLAASADTTAEAAAPTSEPPLSELVRTMLSNHCGRCHQARQGSLSGESDGAFIDRVARDPSLVVPGNADASALAAALDYPIAAHIEPQEKKPARWVFSPKPSQIAALRAWIDGLPAEAPTPAPGNSDPAAAEVAPLSIWTDQATYKAGSEARIHASVKQTCHLTLIAVDSNGQAVVLFPNDARPDNKIEPGTTVTVPDDGDPFLLRFDMPGRERIVGICIPGERKDPRGIRHDYIEQRFTILGSWETFLGRARRPGFRAKRRWGRISAVGRGFRTPREPLDLFAPLGEWRTAINVIVTH